MSRTVSFQPLLFGGDINVYSVARAFHEAYGVKSVAFGKFHTFPCAFSSIIDYHSLPPFYVDAMEVLAELAVVRCGKQLRTI